MVKKLTDDQQQDIQDRKDLLEIIEDLKASQAKERHQNLYATALEGSKRDPYTNRDFYLVLVKTNEQDEMRKPIDRIFVRLSCPTPGYNQDVFKYRHTSGELEYLWSIPRKHQYWQIWKNRLKYLDNKETKRLASFIIMMETGDLLKWVKKENGELPDAVIKVNQPETIA